MTDRFQSMLEQLRDYKMDAWETRAQAISWAVGQVMCMRDGHRHDEWALRKSAAEAYDATNSPPPQRPDRSPPAI